MILKKDENLHTNHERILVSPTCEYEHLDRHTNRQTDRRIDRQTDRQTERKKDRQTEEMGEWESEIGYAVMGSTNELIMGSKGEDKRI